MGYTPSFITGANAKIRLGNITIAYAQDVSYNVEVTSIPVETMGRYEVVSNEPVAYSVQGTLSIIRYAASAAATGKPFQAAAGGNGMKKLVPGTGGNASMHFDPKNLLSSETFTLEIMQKGMDAANPKSIVKLHDCRFVRKGASVNKRGILTDGYAFNCILHDDDSTSAAADQVARSGDADLV